MKTLVVYDSYFGNTKKVAEVIGKEFNDSKVIFVSDFKKEMLKDVELLIVGSPIRAWNPSERTNKFLASLKEGDLEGIKVTCFDTRVKLFIHGDAAKKIAATLEKAGGKLITEPNNFTVVGAEGPLYEGELGKATDWAKNIKEKLNKNE